MLRYFVQHRLAANVLMCAMLIMGVMGMQKMPTQLMPDVSVPFVELNASWNGIPAQLVASEIITPLSELIKQNADVTQIYADASDGHAWLGVEFKLSSDMEKELSELQKTVNSFDWPNEVTVPQAQQVEFREQVGMVILAMPGDINSLRSIAQQAKDELIARGLAMVNIQGLPGSDVHWRPELSTWLNMNVQPNELLGSLRQQGSQLGAGVSQNQTLIAGDKVDSARELYNFTIGNQSIAQLHPFNDLSDRPAVLIVDGNPAVILEISRSDNLGTVEAGNIIKAWQADFSAQHGDNIYVSSFADTADFVQGHLDLLTSNALLGLVLVLLTLFVLLNSRVAFWTAAGIPVAIIGTLGLLYAFGGSLNILSIFALLIALGIVVDDAIVVSEETLTLKESGMSAADAAVAGVKRMFMPVTAAALTSVAAFSPLLFLPGIFGEMLKPVPMVIICVLIASLFECFFILPGHLHHSLAKRDSKKPSKMRLKVDQTFDALRENHFKKFITWLTEHRFITLAFAVGMFAISITMVVLDVVKFSPELEVEFNVVSMRVNFDERTRDDEQIAYSKSVLDAIKQLDAEHGFMKQHIYVQDVESHSTQVYVELVDRNSREFDNAQVAKMWKELIAPSASVTNLRSSEDSSQSVRGGNTDVKQIAYRLSAERIELLQAAVSDLKQQLSTVPYLTDVNDSFPAKSLQLNFKANALAVELGMNDQYLAMQTANWLQNQEVLTFARDSDTSKLKIGIADADKQRLSVMESLPIKAPTGEWYTLGQLTVQERNIAITSFSISDGQVTATVNAMIDHPTLEVSDVSGEIYQTYVQPVSDRYGLSAEATGSESALKEIMDAMMYAVPIALFLIYLVLAWVFESWFWPMAVVSAIPFAITGAIFGHWLLGFDFTMMSILGLFGVAGIVVNDSIILIDRYRQLLEQGHEKYQAIVMAACQRFRAVLLTTITTVIGLVPILFEQSIEAQIVKTMAIALAFGLTYGTFVVLIITPAFMTFVRTKRFEQTSAAQAI